MPQTKKKTDQFLDDINSVVIRRKPGRNQDAIDNYRDVRISHADEEEFINEKGKREKAWIVKTHPDLDAIEYAIRRKPLNPKEHPRRK